MQQADLVAVTRLADAVFPDHHEERDVFAEKLALYPDGCFALPVEKEALGGYLFSHPWISGSVPALNRKLGALPDRCDCLYLHDLTLAPALRGRRLGSAMVQMLERHALRAGLKRLALTSLADSTDFWRAAGFAPGVLTDEPTRLFAYGEGAQYMVRDLR